MSTVASSSRSRTRQLRAWQPPTRFPRRAVHLDFHTMPRVYDVGRDFDAKEFAETLAGAMVDYVTVFARCNLGFAYYPTKVGIVHPGLASKDLLGPMIEACHKRSIRVSVYINAGLDHEHAVRNRQWCKINSEGQVYRMHQMGHFFRPMCLNTGYRNHLLAMIEEILAGYPIDGLFLDCFDYSACYGAECVDGMQGSGIDALDEEQVKQFCVSMTEGFLDEAEALVRAQSAEIALYFNGIRYTRQPTHVELEVLPTGKWGYDYLPFVIRYARTLGKPFFTQTGRFHKSWGDLGGVRSGQSLLFDCYYSIANGGTCCIGDHMHPRGKLEPEVYRLIGDTYRKIAELEPWITGARGIAEIVVLDPTLAAVPGPTRIGPGHSLQGAARMLSELQYQFDLSDGEIDFEDYQVVVLPDAVPVDKPLAAALDSHMERGGAIVSSGFAGLTPDKSGFALDAYALDFEGPEPHSPTFFEALPPVADRIPQMPLTVYEPGIAMSIRGQAQVLARLRKPYFNYREWDGYHEHLYVPPEEDCERPAAVRCGSIVHFSFPLFSNYINHAVVAYRTLLGNCMAQVLPHPLVKAEGLPSFARATVTATSTCRLVHLLAFVPELRGNSQVVEDAVHVPNVSLSLRTDDLHVSQVYLAPSRQSLPFSIQGTYTTVQIPEISGYQLVVFELA